MTAIWNLVQSWEDANNHLHDQSFPTISEWWDKLIERKAKEGAM
jgi:hypothetical protein